MGEAAEAIATGRRLREQHEVDDAFRAGDLSFDQASAVSRAAAADPAAARPMLVLARRETLGTVRMEARKVTAAVEEDRLGRYVRQCRAASFRHGTSDDGMTWGHFRLPPDSGAAVVTRIEAETDRVYRAARSSGRHDPRERYAAEALVALVTRADAGPARARGRAAPAARTPAAGAPPIAAEIVVMADLAALRRGAVEGDEVCTIPGFGDVPVEVPRRLLDTGGFLTLLLRDGINVLAVHRVGRRIPAALRTALLVERFLTDGEVRCSVEGCDRTRVEWDHITAVADGGRTERVNLQPLCVTHHRQKSATGPGPRCTIPIPVPVPGRPGPLGPGDRRAQIESGGAAMARRDPVRASGPGPGARYRSGPRISALVGTIVPAVTSTCSTSVGLVGGRAADQAHALGDAVHAVDVGLAELAAVGVDREAAAELDVAVADEVLRLAAPAEAELLELRQHERREVVVDDRGLHVVGPEAGGVPELARDQAHLGEAADRVAVVARHHLLVGRRALGRARARSRAGSAGRARAPAW